MHGVIGDVSPSRSDTATVIVSFRQKQSDPMKLDRQGISFWNMVHVADHSRKVRP
eukprot:jgi/Psemu1/307699/fgenesh1_kg.348_\